MVQIVTDGTARFPNPTLLNNPLITIAPTFVRCGSSRIADGPETDLANVWPILNDCKSDPEILPPTVDQMAEIYENLQSESNQILSIHTASGLTGAFHNAHVASQQSRGRLDIHVIDSQSVSIGLGLLVQAAVQSSERGQDLESVVRLVRGMIPRLYMVFFLDELFFLERNGLISRSQAILGNMLGIIPFLAMEEGHLIPMEKVKSRLRALEKLIEFVCEFSSVEQLGILHGTTAPNVESVSVTDRLRSIYPSTPISSASYGAAFSTYVGINSLGAVVLESEEGTL